MRNRYFILAVLLIVAAGGVLMLSKCSAEKNQDPLLQGVKTDQHQYKLGRNVNITFAVKNTGSKPVILHFSSTQHFDVWIKRGSQQIFKLSHGRAYGMIITQLELSPNQTKTFTTTWDQKNDEGQEVGPGAYTVYAQLTTMKKRPPAVSATFEIGSVEAMLVPVTIKQAIDGVYELRNQDVAVSATYRGWQPNPNDPNTKGGPPVSRSDWAICDGSGCMYVSGHSGLDPVRDVGKKVNVIGRLAKTEKGQVYLILKSLTLGK